MGSQIQWEITIEKTPNPSTVKFQFNHPIADRTAQFERVGDTDESPLAAKLFGFPWTTGVFIGENFVSITKAEWVDWEMLSEPLSGLLKEHMNIGEPVLFKSGVHAQENSEDENDTVLIKQIKKVLDAEIRPAVAMDGGDIVFRKFDSGRLYLSMKGACSGCPSSQVTLKEGIEVRMKELFKDIQEVIAI